MNDLDIKEIRAHLGVTQAELAKRLGVSERTVQNWESGASIPATKIKSLKAILANPIRQQFSGGGDAVQIGGDINGNGNGNITKPDAGANQKLIPIKVKATFGANVRNISWTRCGIAEKRCILPVGGAIFPASLPWTRLSFGKDSGNPDGHDCGHDILTAGERRRMAVIVRVGVPLSPLKRRVHRHSRKMDTKMDTKTPDSDVKSGVLCSIITHNVFPK